MTSSSPPHSVGLWVAAAITLALMILGLLGSNQAHAFFNNGGHTIWYGTPEAAHYVGKCQENCCCRVCGSPTSDAFPYGLMTTAISLNAPNPSVRGSSCHVSVWSDQAYNDTTGKPAVVPSTIFWTNYSVFLDYNSHIAPISCDCCKYSTVDTSCKETAPIATYPRYFYVTYGKVQEYQSATLVFMDGVELNASDYVELRNDTHCGFLHPAPVLRRTNLQLINSSLNSVLTIPKLPSRGCYKVCYFASSLTTPQWYDLGYLTVAPKPQTTVSFLWGAKDVLLAGNTATVTFFGRGMMSVFDDIAEMRTSGSCGGGSPTTTTSGGTNGILDVVSGAEWCKPAVTAKITSVRPLNYIAIKYSDCVAKNRVYQSRVQWTLTLPFATTDLSYTMCYRQNGTWLSLGSKSISGQRTADVALNTFFNAAGGPYWKRKAGWGGSNACTFFGVRCDASNNVISLYLSRNNISGTMPAQMFYAPYFTTMTHVSLDMNALRGTIPREIGALRNLKFLDLGFNQLSGTVPTTLDDTSVYIAYMGNNLLSGPNVDNLDSIGLQWNSYGNNISDPAVDPIAPGCPTDVMECSQRGTTDYGTIQCGNDGITKAACSAYGCCFNAQAPLVFGGAACFTKRRVTYKQYPPCQQLTCWPTSS